MDIEIDSAPDQAILSTLREGKLRQAAGLMVRHHATTVYGVCQRLIPDPEQAEELTHQTFSAAFAALAGFRQQRSPREWLVQLAERLCRESLADSAGAGAGEPTAEEPGFRHPGTRRITDSLQRRLEVLATSL
jgi:DNA-directed RNA polymerase specialized sigma24 family protein